MSGVSINGGSNNIATDIRVRNTGGGPIDINQRHTNTAQRMDVENHQNPTPVGYFRNGRPFCRPTIFFLY